MHPLACLPPDPAETKKGAARVVELGQGQAAAAGAGAGDAVQLATLSACGRLVFGATKGMVAVHRRSDLALLDLVVVSWGRRAGWAAAA